MGNEQRQLRQPSDYDVDWRDDPANTLDLERSRTPRWLVIIPLLLLALTGVFLWDATRSDDSIDSGADESPSLQSEVEDEPADDAGEAEGGGETAAADDGTSTDDGDGASAEPADAAGGEPGALPAPPTGAPYVDATLVNEAFTLSGVVPSQELKAQLEGQAELAYAPFFTSELEVDESLEPADWLAAAPNVVGLLPMITDGTIRLQDGEATLVGRSPKPEYAAAFEGAVGALSGMPVTADGITITNLEPPLFITEVENGTATLEGYVPSEEIIQLFVQGAAAVYGEENVTNNLTVDPGTYISFWMYTMPANFFVLQPFSAYQLKVENGQTSGRLEGGVAFEIDSAELSVEGQQILQIGVAIMARDLSLAMQVIGHTDSSGSDDYNQELSLRRARAAVAFFEAAGIAPERMAAEGRGETEPIAPNDTEEGRALNRRVEFRFAAVG